MVLEAHGKRPFQSERGALLRGEGAALVERLGEERGAEIWDRDAGAATGLPCQVIRRHLVFLPGTAREHAATASRLPPIRPMTLRRCLVPRSVSSARIEHRGPARSVKCQHLIPFWRPSCDLHAGRTRRHPRDGDARDRRAIAQEPIDDVGGHMALDDVIRDEGRVAGSQGGGDAEATAEWCEILDVLRRNRVSVAAQVSHPRAATPSGGRPVDGDGRSGAGRGTSQSRLPEGHGQHAQDHRPSFEPHSCLPEAPVSFIRR
jgi:hypothetical protein